jgi:acetyl-CoA carboxylase biotin carboxylase subunit
LSRKSYLSVENILAAAEETGADALHPGYGFLAENSVFAAQTSAAGMTFIGPSPRAIELAGDKATARQTLAELDIPIVPGSEGELTDEAEAAKCAAAVGYPVILKASAGGGGRGMRIANDEAELRQAFKVASGEASATFGNGALYLEKYIQNPRHIEIQLLCDQHGNAVHLGERECSIQKRHQKLIEEAPSPFVDEELRTALGRVAIKVAKAIGYENAGTVEFLVDHERNFYFMELNARIQVEHPVTEMITGLDLVEEQLKIAADLPLSFTQDEVALNGWAIECRINATDPDNDFMPSPGEIEGLQLPEGEGIRLDTHLCDRMFVVPFYDALLGKLITWGEGRDTALERMRAALEQTKIGGIATTIDFNRKVLADKKFQSGDLDTHFLDDF